MTQSGGQATCCQRRNHDSSAPLHPATDVQRSSSDDVSPACQVAGTAGVVTVKSVLASKMVALATVATQRVAIYAVLGPAVGGVFGVGFLIYTWRMHALGALAADNFERC